MITKLIHQEQENLPLFYIVSFISGIAFAASFLSGLKASLLLLGILLFLAIIFYFLYVDELKSIIFASVLSFLCGCFFLFFYEKVFLSHNEINAKIYVDVVGKISAIKEFQNSKNNLSGVNLKVSNLVFYKIIPSKKTKNEKYKNIAWSNKKESPRKPTKNYRIKNFINLEGYQEVNRKFLDEKNAYMEVDWQAKKSRKVYPKPPKKISVNLAKYKQDLNIGDKISFRAILNPIKKINNLLVLILKKMPNFIILVLLVLLLVTSLF